jgi:hypothetical protein
MGQFPQQQQMMMHPGQAYPGQPMHPGQMQADQAYPGQAYHPGMASGSPPNSVPIHNMPSNLSPHAGYPGSNGVGANGTNFPPQPQVPMGFGQQPIANGSNAGWPQTQSQSPSQMHFQPQPAAQFPPQAPKALVDHHNPFDAF